MTEAEGKDEKVSKDTLFQSIVKEAGEFYNLILTVSSAFLGGTLIFLEKIAPNPVQCSLWVLYLGWVSLIGSIAISAYVRLKNLESGRLALEERYEDAQQLDRKKEWLSSLMTILMVAGVALITIFGIINLCHTGQ